MEVYNIGEIWWVHFPFEDSDEIKRRPAIVIDDDTIAVLAMYVTSQNDKTDPMKVHIDDWKAAGLGKDSWAKIDRIIMAQEWQMDRKIGDLSERDLKKILQLAKEALSQTQHEFSILAVKNTEGQFLQKYDDRWNAYLFPYTRSSDNNKTNVVDFASQLFEESDRVEYVSVSKHCKYSVSDDVYKIYNHKLYKLILESVPETMTANEFEINGERYRWMTFEEMEKDERIMELNDDVIAFVKAKCK